MNFGELIAKGGALFARKGADALADTLETAPPADLARIQASVSGAAVESIFSGDVVQTTYSVSVRSGPGWLTEVYCASGSSVLLSVYDNNAVGIGRVVLTGTFSAGKRLTGRWPLVNGAVALFDTGVFEFVFSGE